MSTLGSDKVDVLAQRVSDGASAAAPAGWRELRLEISASVLCYNFLFYALMPDDTWVRFVATSPDVTHGSEDLRAACYLPRRGTWFVVRMQVDTNHQMSYALDYDGEPAGQSMLKPGSYARDLQSFPRAEEHRPRWLRDAVALSEKMAARNAADQARRATRTARRKAEREAVRAADHHERDAAQGNA